MGCCGSSGSRPCIEYAKGEDGGFICDGRCRAMGVVWGKNPYTADSSVCKAARHAGVIGPDGGAFHVTKRPGQSHYDGTDANGVQSLDHLAYDASIAISKP